MNLLLVTGIGAVALTGPGDFRPRDHMGDQADEIVALDPRHPLPARAERAAEAEFERRQHPRDEAALGAEHEADAQAAPPSPRALRPRRAAFSQASQSSWLKQACDLAEFGQRLILPEPVPADRRAGDQHRRLALEPRDQAHDIAGHVDARLEDLAALGLGPQPVADRLAREIDDRIDPRVRRQLIEARDQR